MLTCEHQLAHDGRAVEEEEGLYLPHLFTVHLILGVYINTFD